MDTAAGTAKFSGCRRTTNAGSTTRTVPRAGSGKCISQPRSPLISAHSAAGASSRDPSYRGPPDATLPFRLSNGQLDYPESWTLPREVVERALAHFRVTGERPPFVHWHDDG